MTHSTVSSLPEWPSNVSLKLFLFSYSRVSNLGGNGIIYKIVVLLARLVTSSKCKGFKSFERFFVYNRIHCIIDRYVNGINLERVSPKTNELDSDIVVASGFFKEESLFRRRSSMMGSKSWLFCYTWHERLRSFGYFFYWVTDMILPYTLTNLCIWLHHISNLIWTLYYKCSFVCLHHSFTVN